MIRNCFFTVAIAAGLTLLPVVAMADDIPDNLVGHWAKDGACNVPASSVHFEKAALRFGHVKDSQGATFFEDDSPAGNDAVHWAEEGEVANFEYDAAADRLLYNEQGYGMGVPPVIYTRCPA